MPQHTIDHRRRRLGAATLVAWLAPGAALRPATAHAASVFGGAERPALALALDCPPALDPAGFLVSEKFDGVRAVWDGASLRFRSGQPVHAPGWFTARLPAQALDGELWIGRGRFEAVAAAVRREQPLDAEWRQISYRLFELPGAPGGFAQRFQAIEALVRDTGFAPLLAVAQQPVADAAALRRRLAEVVAGGGEGLVLHRADAPYRTGRSDALLKLKPLNDAEAVVVGHVPGRGKHAGRLGALQVRTDEGVGFEIGTGFTDAERAAPPPIGSTVTFTHRGLTRHGVPRFASFLRLRSDV